MTTAAGKRLTWDQIRARLSQLAQAAGDAAQPRPEHARQILEERARALARVPPAGLPGGELVELVAFHLGQERYSLPASCVREVTRLNGCTPVPGAPDNLAGIVNLRGDILAVFDLAHLLGLGRERRTTGALIVLGGARAEFGIVAGIVEGVKTVSADEILDPPATIAGPGRALLRGITRDALIVLDGPKLLCSPSFFIDVEDPQEANHA